jgi:hypothetical protein
MLFQLRPTGEEAVCASNAGIDRLQDFQLFGGHDYRPRIRQHSLGNL